VTFFRRGGLHDLVFQGEVILGEQQRILGLASPTARARIPAAISTEFAPSALTHRANELMASASIE